MMKNIIALVLIVLFTSCSKDDEYTPIFLPGSQTYGWATASKNGLAFEASALAQVHEDRLTEYFGFSFGTFTEEGFSRESISLNEIKYETGEYPVKGSPGDIYDGFVGSSYHTLAEDGDVGEDRYILKDSPDNLLIISTVDTVENIIRGSFHLEFKLDPNRDKVNPDNPDNVVFSSGEFETSFIK